MRDMKCTSKRFHPDSAMDYLPVEQLRQLQLVRYQAIVKRAYDKVELFRQRMEDAGGRAQPGRHREAAVYGKNRFA